MDFLEFRQKKLWIPIAFGPEEQRAEFKVAYTPGLLDDRDLQYLGSIENMRLVDWLEEPEEAPVENRAARRVRQRDSSRLEGPSGKKDERPTLNDYMERLIVDWDLTYGKDENGEPIPWPSVRANFEQMELGVRVEIVMSVMRDYLNRPNLGAFSSLFSQMATKESGQTGLNSSSSQINGEGTQEQALAASFPGTTSVSPN